MPPQDANPTPSFGGFGLTKPFGGEELVARAEAILRRASDSDRRNPPMNYRCGDDHLLRDASRAALPGQPVRYIDQQWEGLVFSIRPPNWRAKDTDVLFGAKFDGMASASNISPVVPRGTKARPN